jgi:phosphatidylethanolamine-binding protein (PEBP) family uncharacterized protein
MKANTGHGGWRRGAAAGRLAGAWLLAWAAAGEAGAHNLTGDPARPHYDRSVRPPKVIIVGRQVARAETGPATGAAAGERLTPAQAEAFRVFAPHVRVRWDDAFLYVESNGLPAHGMMTGITAWQQQVPLPQPYAGTNAWRLPRRPEPAAQPVSIRDRFLRGAIALAANGVPIFNPQNNRGEISAEIGELDEWGGHCGRADDYHYHAAPLHLQATLGRALPIAYALDGYPIYGLTEPDGITPAGLDAFNGHTTAALGYHYHASLKYPYVNGGFHGVVTEREEQVDPQPRAQGVRPALTALRGAKITGFAGTPGEGRSTLDYTVNGRPAAVSYAPAGGGVWSFRFTGPDGSVREETYRAGERGGGGAGGGKRGGGKAPKKTAADTTGRAAGRAGADGATAGAAATSGGDRAERAGTGSFALRSPAVGVDGVLPREFTGDGAGISPPLAWSGAPAGTRSYAVIMDHVDPTGRMKWYWTLFNIPAEVTALPADARGVGELGNNGVNRRAGYAPPHSKGPGAKTYVLTVYALSAPLTIAGPAAEVNRETLLSALRPVLLGQAELKVTHSRTPEGERAEKPRGGPKTL